MINLILSLTGYRRANSALFAWFASASLKSFPFISAETDQSGNEKPIGIRDQLLGSVNVWPTTARPFADLFPAAYIASNLYAEAIDQDTWEWLEEQRFFSLDPVIRHSQDVDGDDLVGLLEQPFPREEEDLEHKINSMEVVDLTHLTLKDKGVIDGVRSSKSKCVQFLEFIIRHVLPTNSDSLNYQVKECSCAKKHSIHSAMWVSVLKTRQWVYERKSHAARPTSANLAKLWKESAELMSSIARTEVILFLRRLEVNASEIQRGASSMPESDSLKMEKAMVALLAATNNDVNSLQILAEITASEPELLNDYKERLKQREPTPLGFRAEGVVVRPLSDASLCFQTFVIMRRDDDSRLTNEFVRSFLRRYADQRRPPKPIGSPVSVRVVAMKKANPPARG